MCGVPGDGVVETFTPDRTDNPLDISVLPWRPRRKWAITDAHRSEPAAEDLAIGAVIISNGNCQVNWIRSPVWVPPRSEKAQIIAAYELAPPKLIATDGKFSELSINLSIPRRLSRPAFALALWTLALAKTAGVRSRK